MLLTYLITARWDEYRLLIWKLKESHPKFHHLLVSEKRQQEILFLFPSEVRKEGYGVVDGVEILPVYVLVVPFQSMMIHWYELSDSSPSYKDFLHYFFVKRRNKQKKLTWNLCYSNGPDDAALQICQWHVLRHHCSNMRWTKWMKCSCQGSLRLFPCLFAFLCVGTFLTM